MSNNVNFTKEAIEALAIKKKQYEVSDEKIPSLRLMINPGGSRTFYLYRKIEGTPQRIKIGRYGEITISEARGKARILNSKITLGDNPVRRNSQNKHELTFSDLFQLYYIEHALKYTKRPSENRKMIVNHVFPYLGKNKLKDITPRIIRDLHTRIGNESGQAGANRVIQIVNAVYNFGIRNEYFTDQNPCFGLKKYRIESRDRFLTKIELLSFFDALSNEDKIFQDYFKILLFTGARKSNVLSMKWEDIDFNLSRWRIPPGETKNSDVNIVPLVGEVIEILKRRSSDFLQSESCCEYVFPSSGKDGYLKDPKKSFSRIKNRMGVLDIRMHDLRRTLGSYMAIGGASLAVIGKALNHKSQDSTAIYARLSEDPVFEAMTNAVMLIKSSEKELKFKTDHVI